MKIVLLMSLGYGQHKPSKALEERALLSLPQPQRGNASVVLAAKYQITEKLSRHNPTGLGNKNDSQKPGSGV